MNIFFKINGEIITPELRGSVLPSITRASIIELAEDIGLKVTERRISIDEIYGTGQSGSLEEVFGTGTAAIVSPVGRLVWRDKTLVVNNGEMEAVAETLYETLTGIQTGKIEYKFGWIHEIK